MIRSLFLVAFVVPLLIGAASSCSTIPNDTSAFARVSGESSVILGSSCYRPLEKGYSSCQLTKGQPLPKLSIAFLNAAEYAVSDCDLNLWKTGSALKGTLVEIDTAELTNQVEKNGFCLLKIEAIEKFEDQRDPSQLRSISMTGGFFIELLDKDYYPDFPSELTAFCYEYRLERTTAGRTKVTQKACK